MGKAVQYATYMSVDNKNHVIEHAIEFEDLLTSLMDNDASILDNQVEQVPEMHVIRKVLLNQMNSVMLCAVSNPDKLTKLMPMFIDDSNDIIGAALSLAFHLGKTSEPSEYNPFLDD